MLFSQGFAAQTICLNMIVKNESPVIARCLESVKPLIDYWVIIDTGSSDQTKEIIRAVMKGIPGELHEAPWTNFEVNRNQVLDFSKGKGDYVLFIDADEEFVYQKGFKFPKLEKDFYQFVVKNETNGSIFSEYHRILLINNHFNWRWKGVIHEDVYCKEAKNHGVMPGIFNISRTQEGARGKDPKKYLKDALVLEKALESEPTNSRYVYYLAASYLNAGELEKAYLNFERRVAMEPNRLGVSEIYDSLYFMGIIEARQKRDSKAVIDRFSVAHFYSPHRAEPLYELGSYLLEQGQFLLAELVLKKALELPLPGDLTQTHYIINWIYDWGVLHKLAECTFKMGRFQESKTLLEKLITKPLPPDLLEAMRGNLAAIKQMQI